MNLTRMQQNIALIIASLVLALLCAEIILRIIIRPEPDIVRVEDHILGYRAKPGGEWDESGFRNPTIPKNPSIISMGDSQTRGLNARSEESWPQQLEQLLNQEVYQMAFDRYGTVQYAYLTNEALENFEPHLVIWGLYLGNDLYDTYEQVYTNDYWKELRKPGFSGDPSMISKESEAVRESVLEAKNRGTLDFMLFKIREWLRLQSRLYMLLGDGTRGLREALDLAQTEAERQESRKKWAQENPNLAFIYDKKPLETILSPLYRFDVLDLERPETREGWRIAQSLIQASSEKMKREGGEFLLTIIPTKEMVYGMYMENQGEAIPKHFYDIVEEERKLHETIFAFCTEYNLSCHAVVPDLAAALTRGEKIYPHTLDGHPLADGYEIIAHSIEAYIRANNLLDR